MPVANNERSAGEIADELRGFLEDASGDIADSIACELQSCRTKTEFKRILKQNHLTKIANDRERLSSYFEMAKHPESPYILKECLGDEVYSTPQFAQDMLGDRLYDECRDNVELRNEVVDKLAKGLSHFPKTLWTYLKRD